jgi:hypothetical protein
MQLYRRRKSERVGQFLLVSWYSETLVPCGAGGAGIRPGRDLGYANAPMLGMIDGLVYLRVVISPTGLRLTRITSWAAHGTLIEGPFSVC